MAFLDELGKTLTKTSQKISQTGQTVAKKAKDMAEVSNLKLQMKEEERQLRGIYEEIGEKYCDLYGECPEEVLKEEIQRVTEAKVKIQALKENTEAEEEPETEEKPASEAEAETEEKAEE